jgi:Domain of unknown function (DUF4328)
MKAVRTRAAWVKGLLIVTAIGGAVAAVTDVQEYRNPLRESELFEAIGIGQVLLLLPTAILFIAWLHRAYGWMPEVGSTPRFKRWWTIVGWLIPIVNFFRPKQIVDELWKAGHKPALTVPGFVHLWWGAWIADLLLSNVVERLYATADTLSEIRLASLGHLVVDVLDIAAALLAIKVVESTTSGLEQASARSALESRDPEEEALFLGS